MENMTPAMASEVLYDDILNLSLALEEHRQLEGVLSQVAQVRSVTSLLHEVLDNQTAKSDLIKDLTDFAKVPELYDELMDLDGLRLAQQLIAGTPIKRDSLTKYISEGYYALPPLSNTFFTRDTAMCVYDRILPGRMAFPERFPEARIMHAIFSTHSELGQDRFWNLETNDPEATIEGGDVLVFSEDLLIVGLSERTSSKGIDALARALCEAGKDLKMLVVDVPKTRATIHLDMVFTLVDQNCCVVFPPLFLGPNRCRVFEMTLAGGKVAQIEEREGLLEALAKLGHEMTPVRCGGRDTFSQEREQWASGANFFAFGPGRVIGFRHNQKTTEALDNAGFEIVTAQTIIDDQFDLAQHQGRVAVTMDGAELARGGGGCRCMTMPIVRKGI